MLTRRNHESRGARQGVYGGVTGQTAWKLVPCQQDPLGSVHPLPAPLWETQAEGPVLWGTLSSHPSKHKEGRARGDNPGGASPPTLDQALQEVHPQIQTPQENSTCTAEGILTHVEKPDG